MSHGMGTPLEGVTEPRRPVITVLGNLTLDLVIRGIDSLPKWGREVLGADRRLVRGGQAYLLARALRRLGASVRLISRVGDDPWGMDFVRDLREAGIDFPAATVVAGAASSLTVAMVRADGERAFISDLSVMGELSEESASTDLAEADSDLVCLVGIFNLPGMTLNGAARLLESVRTWGVATALDTGWDPSGWSSQTIRATRAALRHVDVFLPNEIEAAALTGERSPETAARSLLGDGPGIVVVKCGDRGAIALGRDIEVHAPSYPAVVSDTIGAGDVFNAGFLWAHLAHLKPEECLRFANATAAFYVSRQDDRFPAIEDVEAIIAGPQSVTGASSNRTVLS